MGADLHAAHGSAPPSRKQPAVSGAADTTTPQFRITALRTLDDEQLLQMTEDDPNACPAQRELANRAVVWMTDKVTVRRLRDEIDRLTDRLARYEPSDD